jgi:hypothetical protein
VTPRELDHCAGCLRSAERSCAEPAELTYAVFVLQAAVRGLRVAAAVEAERSRLRERRAA